MAFLTLGSDDARMQQKPGRSEVIEAKRNSSTGTHRDFVPMALDCGRPREVPSRDVLNATLYFNRTGQREMPPHDLLPKNTDYDYLLAWRDDGS